MTRASITVRRRLATDIPALSELLAKQRSATGYPEIWPLPMPVPSFIQRDDEEAAWVAELSGGEIVGHIANAFVCDGAPDPGRSGSTTGLGDVWATAYGCQVSELRCIGTLFTDAEYAGAGVGSALLAAATQDIVQRRLMPVLDCIKTKRHVVQFYERRGWTTVAEMPAPWSPKDRIDVVLMILPQYITNKAAVGAVADKVESEPIVVQGWCWPKGTTEDYVFAIASQLNG